MNRTPISAREDERLIPPHKTPTGSSRRDPPASARNEATSLKKGACARTRIANAPGSRRPYQCPSAQEAPGGIRRKGAWTPTHRTRRSAAHRHLENRARARPHQRRVHGRPRHRTPCRQLRPEAGLLRRTRQRHPASVRRARRRLARGARRCARHGGRTRHRSYRRRFDLQTAEPQRREPPDRRCRDRSTHCTHVHVLNSSTRSIEAPTCERSAIERPCEPCSARRQRMRWRPRRSAWFFPRPGRREARCHGACHR